MMIFQSTILLCTFGSSHGKAKRDTQHKKSPSPWLIEKISSSSFQTRVVPGFCNANPKSQGLSAELGLGFNG